MEYPSSRSAALVEAAAPASPFIAAAVLRRRLIASDAESALQFWWQSVRLPLALFVFAAAVLATTDADIGVARWFFFDSLAHHWRGTGNWWINEFLHVGGRWLVRVAVLAAVTIWASTFADRRRWRWRRPAGYFVVSMVLSVGAVGLLKTLTNVDCPWDLAPFGGRFPYVHLFAHRPEYLPRGQCFPAAHASSGYALMALYFVFRERSRALALTGLAVGILIGLVFGLAQQSRGAHLLSHDVWSAMLAWLIPLSLYTFAFKRRLWRRGQAAAAGAGEYLRSTMLR